MDITKLLDLPADILISQMTYYPFETVRNYCQVNRRMTEICTSPKYSGFWKKLIQDTYGYAPQADHYDYYTYVNLINNLPANVQIEIYRRQKDWDNYHRVVSNLPLNQQLEIYRKNKDLTDYYRVAVQLFYPEVNIQGVTNYEKLWNSLTEKKP